MFKGLLFKLKKLSKQRSELRPEGVLHATAPASVRPRRGRAKVCQARYGIGKQHRVWVRCYAIGQGEKSSGVHGLTFSYAGHNRKLAKIHTARH